MEVVTDPMLATSAAAPKSYVDYLVRSRMTAYDEQQLSSDISLMTDDSVKKFYLDEADVEAQRIISAGQTEVLSGLESRVRSKVDALLDDPSEIADYTTWIATQLPSMSTVISGVSGIKPDISGMVKDECYAVLPSISDNKSARQKAAEAALALPDPSVF